MDELIMNAFSISMEIEELTDELCDIDADYNKNEIKFIWGSKRMIVTFVDVEFLCKTNYNNVGEIDFLEIARKIIMLERTLNAWHQVMY